jgi:hypothetical protein
MLPLLHMYHYICITIFTPLQEPLPRDSVNADNDLGVCNTAQDYVFHNMPLPGCG